MHPRNGLAILVLLSFISSSDAAEPAMERADWKKHFDGARAIGTIVVIDERASNRGAFVYNASRSNVRFSPASTFKIPHTLFALQDGAVRDEFQVFKWDGVRRTFSGHNQDQDLRSAMRFSTLWVYQQFAKQIGEPQAKKYLSSIDYGNVDPTTPTGDYWVDGNLRISAIEQIAFLQKLYRNQLPFPLEHQRLVKDLMVIEADYEWILRAKTGWEGQYGWWVGWVEWSEGPVFFALNIDTPNRTADLGKRQTIAKAVLRSIQALPNEPGKGGAR